MAYIDSIPGVSVDNLKNVFGAFDSYVKNIERALHIAVHVREDSIVLEGEQENVIRGKDVFLNLISLSQKGNDITEQQVNYALTLSEEGNTREMVEMDDEVLMHTISGKPVKPKTLGQKKYVEALKKSMITFGVGPAGTGKTYLAIAMAVQAFKNQEVNKIILTRPAIEAGEKLGFLPGDLQSKIDPYLRPLYDALYQIMGAESFQINLEKGAIEVAPLAYMRGRTLDNAYIILDEAQNTTPSQMKMFLTRIGFNSKCVVTGDRTQKDLPSDMTSGLDVALKILKNIEEIAIVELTNKDVVRHPLVQKIVEAYEHFEEKEGEKHKKYDRPYRK